MRAVILISIILFTGSFAWAQKNDKAAETANKTDKKGKAEEATITVGGIELSMEQAINIVIEKNLTLQSAKYDVLMSDSNVMRNDKKFAPVVSAEGKYQEYTNPIAGANALGGNKGYQFDVTAQVSKLFSTGTLVSGGVRNSLADINDPQIIFNNIVLKPQDPAFHRPGFFVGVQQELLRNAFGYADRKMEQILKNQASAQRAATVNLLSALVVQALVDYWQVTIQKAGVENAKLEEGANRQVRKIVANNVRYGLAETFDLNQYNARVASSQAKVSMAEQNYTNAVRKLLRTINMPPETKVEGITNLVDTLPSLNTDDALKAALEKRVDYRNAKLEYETAKIQLDMYENNALPSLTASFQMNTQGQNNALGRAFTDATSLTYPVWSAGIKMSYPLWDKEIKANVRNANFQMTQARIKLENVQQEIRDDVLTKLENVKLAHQVLKNTREARKEAETYYYRLLARTRTGKFNLVAVGQALENMAASRQKELETLVNYNISLLQYDLAKNEIFERYKVDVESILDKVK